MDEVLAQPSVETFVREDVIQEVGRVTKNACGRVERTLDPDCSVDDGAMSMVSWNGRIAGVTGEGHDPASFRLEVPRAGQLHGRAQARVEGNAA